MFGGSSDPALNEDGQLQEKKTFFNRDLPDSYSQGFQIGDSDMNGNSTSRKIRQQQYQQALDMDKVNYVSDQLPDARRTRVFNRKEVSDEEHPLGSSMLMAFGESTKNKMDPVKAELAELKRQELESNRFDIITRIEKDTSPMNSPRYRNDNALGIKDPSTDGTGIMAIGYTSNQEMTMKKQKQKEYMAQLNADTGKIFGVSENYDAATEGLNKDKSFKRIESTGNTGFQISQAESMDMSPSMKSIAFDAKRQRQLAYRSVLDAQKEQCASIRATERSRDTSVNDENNLPFMQNK